MIDAHQRQACRPGERLGELVGADQQGACKARADGDGDAAEIADRERGAGQCFLDDGADVSKVISGRELGDDAAVGAVERDLAMHHVGVDEACSVDDRGGGLVAR